MWTSAGLLKVVFATETLAAGINMPVRTTVISALSRRNDAGHVRLTHNQLLQMAGRAGRRGYDTAGAPCGPQSSTPCVLLECSPSASVQRDADFQSSSCSNTQHRNGCTVDNR